MNKGAVKEFDVTEDFSLMTYVDYLVHVSGLCDTFKK